MALSPQQVANQIQPTEERLKEIEDLIDRTLVKESESLPSNIHIPTSICNNEVEIGIMVTTYRKLGWEVTIEQSPIEKCRDFVFRHPV